MAWRRSIWKLPHEIVSHGSRAPAKARQLQSPCMDPCMDMPSQAPSDTTFYPSASLEAPWQVLPRAAASPTGFASYNSNIPATTLLCASSRDEVVKARMQTGPLVVNKTKQLKTESSSDMIEAGRKVRREPWQAEPHQSSRELGQLFEHAILGRSGSICKVKCASGKALHQRLQEAHC